MSTLISSIHTARQVLISNMRKQGYNVSMYENFTTNELNLMFETDQLDMIVEKIEPDALKELEKRVKMRRDRIVGIDIHATPPGKRLKSLNLLSGGERALTSIAHLAAIMATNPAPFVVLDEVDAALDEANTVRFASILEELRKKTQYIVVTHNRFIFCKRLKI